MVSFSSLDSLSLALVPLSSLTTHFLMPFNLRIIYYIVISIIILWYGGSVDITGSGLLGTHLMTYVGQLASRLSISRTIMLFWETGIIGEPDGRSYKCPEWWQSTWCGYGRRRRKRKITSATQRCCWVSKAHICTFLFCLFFIRMSTDSHCNNSLTNDFHYSQCFQTLSMPPGYHPSAGTLLMISQTWTCRKLLACTTAWFLKIWVPKYRINIVLVKRYLTSWTTMLESALSSYLQEYTILLFHIHPTMHTTTIHAQSKVTPGRH